MATFYGTRMKADAYFTARGIPAWAAASEQDRDAALIRASGYLDAHYRARFPGRKAGGRAQEREWPRAGATDAAGEAIAEDEVPVEVRHATYEAAFFDLTHPGPLAGEVAAGQVIRERVGQIETQYAEPVNAGASFSSTLDDLLSGIVVSKGSMSTSFLVRA